MLADLQAAADFIIARFDNRNAVGVKVTHHHFATVGLKRQAYRSAADVEQGQHTVIFFITIFFQRDRSNLRRSRAGHKSLARIRHDGDVFRLLANRQSSAHAQSLRVDEGHRIVAAIRYSYGRAVRRNPSQPWARAYAYAAERH